MALGYNKPVTVPRGFFIRDCYTSETAAMLKAVAPQGTAAPVYAAMARIAAAGADNTALDPDARLDCLRQLGWYMDAIGGGTSRSQERPAPRDDAEYWLSVWSDLHRYEPDDMVPRVELIAALEAERLEGDGNHECGHTEAWAARAELALLQHDSDAYELVRAEVGDCARCWGAIAHWLLNRLAGADAILAGGNTKAADAVADELVRLLPPAGVTL